MSEQPACWAIVPAAGIGQRMASEVPKQYLTIQGKTIIEHALHAILNHGAIKKIVVALHAEDDKFGTLNINQHQRKIMTVVGGETRAYSVYNALTSIKEQVDPDDFVLVHDAARPCLSYADLDNLISVCVKHQVGGILAVPSADTMKQVQSGHITTTVPRDNIWRAFTPQMFKFEILYQALHNSLQSNIAITDEASAVEQLGHQPCIVQGSARNIKVTCAEDLDIADMYLTLNQKTKE